MVDGTVGMKTILAILMIAAMSTVVAFEIRQDFQGDGTIISRVDTETGGSMLQSTGPVAGGRIVNGNISQFTGLNSDYGRFKVWGSIGPTYRLLLAGTIYATATILTEGSEASINATVKNGTIDEELVAHRTKYLETEGNVSDMILKTKVIW
jgi:hypothetical protein